MHDVVVLCLFSDSLGIMHGAQLLFVSVWQRMLQILVEGLLFSPVIFTVAHKGHVKVRFFNFQTEYFYFLK